MRLKIKDQESVLNIDKSALFDIYKRLHLAKSSYHPVSAIQSDQEYITPPSTTEGYVKEVYEDSTPKHFTIEREYSEPYQPQVQQLIAKIIQRAPMLQSLLQQSPLEQSSDAGYDSEDARIVFEFLLEHCRLRDQEANEIGNRQDVIPDPSGDPSLASIVSEIMPDDMPDMDQMQEPPMNLEMIVESAMAEAMPDQMPEMPDMQEPEQEMTLEMLINLLLGG